MSVNTDDKFSMRLRLNQQDKFTPAEVFLSSYDPVNSQEPAIRMSLIRRNQLQASSLNRNILAD